MERFEKLLKISEKIFFAVVLYNNKTRGGRKMLGERKKLLKTIKKRRASAVLAGVR